jgi:lysozyme family protein
MSTTFDWAVNEVLALEGGYTPDDAGGRANFGINSRFHSNIDIENLTREAAIEIYRTDYWEPLRCDEMPAAIALAVFDSGVNQGTIRATLMLQEALGVTADGVIGPETMAALAKASQGELLQRFLARRALRYALTAGLGRYGLTWFSRILSIHEAALAVKPRDA